MPGVRVSDIISPLAPSDTYPVIDVGTNAKGFPRAVADATARGNIHANFRSTAMFVLQLDTGYVYHWNGSAWSEVNVATTFLALKDTPSSYSGQARRLLRVKTDETGIEFVEVSDVQGHQHTWNATPSGTIDGSNRIFTLASAPNPTGSLLLFKNGLLQRSGAGNDYTLAGNVITFATDNVPMPGDILLASYATT